MGISYRLRRLSWVAWAAVAAFATPAAQAATFGHARLASSVGQPLVIVVPVSGLTAADLQALSARPAPAAAWAQAGLTPPVSLNTLTVSVAPGVASQSARVLRVQSPEAFSGPLADILLDVKTATGSERYQVSLIGPGPARQAAGSATTPGAAPAPGSLAVGTAATSVRRVPMGAIRVRSGDTMFAIARRHAVDGVTVYQLMLALQRANPQAFIHQNINLVRAKASLSVPSVADMLSISDAEARRQFVAQTAAFDRLRGRLATEAGAVQGGQAAAGAVSAPVGHTQPATRTASHDQVRLSEGRSDKVDARTARGHALKDAESRVDQLQDNVQNLNQALQSQGEAARHAVTKGADVIGSSIQKIAGAISQASHEAAAQADDRTAAASAADSDHNGSRATTAEVAVAGGTSGSGGATAGSAAGRAPLAAGQNPAPASLSATASASSAAPQVGDAQSSNAKLGDPAAAAGHDPLFNAAGDSPASQAQAHANAEQAELHATEKTQHRVNWLQDHLLGVMTALLALIVFIIAWLLRRANAARDEADADPHVTEAMVQEKLQGIDLDLPSAESRAPASDA